jgi:hypothetical protein
LFSVFQWLDLILQVHPSSPEKKKKKKHISNTLTMRKYKKCTTINENRQKRKGSSSLHQYAADKILKDSKKHNSSYRTT